MPFQPKIDRRHSERRGVSAIFSEFTFDPNRSMGDMAVNMFKEIIRHWLCGFHKENAIYLPTVIEWAGLNLPTYSDDMIKGHYYCMRSYQALAMARWMYDGDNLPEMWEQARLFNLDAMLKEGAYNKNDYGTRRLDYYMAYCVQAGQYERGIEEYEKFQRAAPPSLKKLLKPRDLAYALCLNKTKQQYDPDDLLQAGRNMLQAHLEEEWLGAGAKADLAPMWLKIIYWHRDPTLTPLQTILKAYENMPNVPVPDFIDLNVNWRCAAL